MAWLRKSQQDAVIDRLEGIATKLEVDLRKVVVELSASAAEQQAAARHLESVATNRVKEGQDAHSPLEN